MEGRASAVHSYKSCAFDVKRHPRGALRAVVAEGTAFGAMAAATNGEHESRRSAGGESSIFVSETTVVEGNRFWRASLNGSAV